MIIEAMTGSQAARLYPHKVNDIVNFNGSKWIVTSITVTMPSRPKAGKPGLFEVWHNSKPYDREAELLNSATGVIFAYRD